MTFELVVRRLAEAEVAEAAAWLDLRAIRLGDQFRNQFEADVKQILEAPLRWPIYYRGEVRRCAMTRFPFGIYYEIHNKKVRILRVVHTSKDPEAIRNLFE